MPSASSAELTTIVRTPATPPPPVARRRRVGFGAALVRRRTALLGLLLIALFVVVAVIGPVLSGYDPNTPALADLLRGPSAGHLLGTDDTGRDIATRIAHGARISLLMGVVAMAISAAVGVPLGLVAGYLGGRWDLAVMRLVDVLLTLPSIVLALVIVSVMGAGVTSVVVAVGITTIPSFARLARA